MEISIKIQPTTFQRLQRHAEPLVDTHDTVINRALNALEGNDGNATTDRRVGDSEQRVDPRVLPRLTYTKVLDATIDGEPVVRPNWNLIVDRMLHRAKKEGWNFGELQRICPVNMVNRRKEDEGYRYLDDIKISVQGQDANSACRAAVTAAQALGIALDIGFMWRHKEGSENPGRRARLQVPDSHKPAN